MTSSDINYKEQIKKQWNNDPCGAITAKQYEIGSPKFYEAVENYRYNLYSPWLKGEINFENYKNRFVLEIGGGLGTDHIQFAKAGAITFDLDLAKEHLRLTKLRFDQAKLNGNFIYADAESICFKENSFDVVYSFGVLHHTPNTQKAIDEIYHVLKQNGVALIMLYHKHSFFYWFSLFFVKGIILGNLFKMNMEEILSRFVEYSTSGALPLVKVYTKKQAKELFKKFSQVEIKIRQLTQEDIPFIGKYIPKKFLYFLSRLIGWNLFIRAKK